nr:MAG TPA: hypothetical protein [Caudoviricetes sp.]
MVSFFFPNFFQLLSKTFNLILNLTHYTFALHIFLIESIDFIEFLHYYTFFLKTFIFFYI